MRVAGPGRILAAAVFMACLGIPSFADEEIPLNFMFDVRKYATNHFPRYCISHIAFHNQKKPRPLYLYGWGIDGSVRMAFSGKGLDNDKFTFSTEGNGSVGFNGYSCTVLPDWVQFACAPLLRRNPRPIVWLTMKSLRLSEDVKVADLKTFFVVPEAGIAAGPRQAPPTIKLHMVADIELRAGERVAICKDIPMNMSISDAGASWVLKFGGQVSFKGSDFGFTGDDAGEITAHFESGAFSAVPAKYRKKDPPKTVETTGDDVGDMLKVIE